jgi:hypothetical protein
MAAKGKGKPGAAGGNRIHVAGHPRARRHIARAKGWGGLGAFALVFFLSQRAAVPFSDALLRGVLGGVAGYLLAWGIAVNVWRHLALAEVEVMRRRLIASLEEQAAQAEAASGDGGARR